MQYLCNQQNQSDKYTFDSFDIIQSNKLDNPLPPVHLLFHLLIMLNIAVPSSNGFPEPQPDPRVQAGHLYGTQGYLLVV